MSEEKDQKTASEIASQGGNARAEKLSPERRKEIAQIAAEKRWGAFKVATHSGILKIGDLEIPCAVLEGEDGKPGARVLSETGVVKALGLYRSGAVLMREKDAAEGGAQMPLYVANKNIKPFVDNELATVLLQPIWYTPPGSGNKNKGVAAEVLPQICDVWLRARDAGVLKGVRQKVVAKNADILMRGLAKVGITALVDEATGYQYDRARHALEEILEQFISKELRPWNKTFPDEFYQHLFRLKKWKLDLNNRRMPILVGKLTNDLVYQRIAPGVLDELKRLTPRNEKGKLKHHYHRRLTGDVGHPKLKEHFAALNALFRAFNDWDMFYDTLKRALPKQQSLPLFDKKGGAITDSSSEIELPSEQSPDASSELDS